MAVCQSANPPRIHKQAAAASQRCLAAMPATANQMARLAESRGSARDIMCRQKLSSSTPSSSRSWNSQRATRCPPPWTTVDNSHSSTTKPWTVCNSRTSARPVCVSISCRFHLSISLRAQITIIAPFWADYCFQRAIGHQLI